MPESSWDGFQWDEPEGFLGLRTSIMEEICRYLPTQRDRYEMCLVHPRWLEAAVNVLWEAPAIHDPRAFEKFVRAILKSRSPRMSVRHLSLCIRDGACDTVFKPLRDSHLARHAIGNVSVLAQPRVILHLVKQCERLTSLKIYGWALSQADLEALVANTARLEALTVIGSNIRERPLTLNGIGPHLRELRLDGDFAIDMHFIATLVSRCALLESLQLPLSESIEGKYAVDRLCTGHLPLKRLTLTRASRLNDAYVHKILHCFPDITEFCVDGAQSLSRNAIAAALHTRPNLLRLDIRADPNIASKDVNYRWPVDFHPLQDLVVEGLPLSDNVVGGITSSCTSLNLLALKGCTGVGSLGLRRLLSSLYKITTLHMIDMPSFDGKALAGLHHSSRLQELYIKDCGDISALDIYNLCVHCNQSLQSIRLVGYDAMKPSVIHSYNIQSQSDTLVLDETAIDAIANLDSYSQASIAGLPENRYLTGRHIILLAQKLGIVVNELETILDAVQEEPDEDDEPDEALKDLQARPTTPALWSQYANTSSVVDMLPKAPTTRPTSSIQHSVRSPATAATPFNTTSERSETYPYMSVARDKPPSASVSEEMDFGDTDSMQRTQGFEEPAPWYSPNEEGRAVEGDEEEQDVMYTPTPAGPAYDMNDTDRYDDDTHDYEPKTTVAEDWPALGPAQPTSGAALQELGGWGDAPKWGNTPSWSKKLSAHSSSKSSPKKPIQSKPWQPDTEANHAQEWQQTALPPPSGRSTSRRMYGTVNVVENEGWGKPAKYVPWDDPRSQGFASDLLEHQRKTPYWDATAGVYRTASTLDALPPSSSTPSKSDMDGDTWPTLERQPPAHPQQQRLEQEQQQQQQQQNGHRARRMQRMRNNLSDSDDSALSREDDGVQFIVSKRDVLLSKAHKLTPTRAEAKSRQQDSAHEDWVNFTAQKTTEAALAAAAKAEEQAAAAAAEAHEERQGTGTRATRTSTPEEELQQQTPTPGHDVDFDEPSIWDPVKPVKQKSSRTSTPLRGTPDSGRIGTPIDSTVPITARAPTAPSPAPSPTPALRTSTPVMAAASKKDKDTLNSPLVDVSDAAATQQGSPGAFQSSLWQEMSQLSMSATDRKEEKEQTKAEEPVLDDLDSFNWDPMEPTESSRHPSETPRDSQETLLDALKPLDDAFQPLVASPLLPQSETSATPPPTTDSPLLNNAEEGNKRGARLAQLKLEISNLQYAQLELYEFESPAVSADEFVKAHNVDPELRDRIFEVAERTHNEKLTKRALMKKKKKKGTKAKLVAKEEQDTNHPDAGSLL